jgi:hypothetical protein
VYIVHLLCVTLRNVHASRIESMYISPHTQFQMARTDVLTVILERDLGSADSTVAEFHTS